MPYLIRMFVQFLNKYRLFWYSYYNWSRDNLTDDVYCFFVLRYVLGKKDISEYSLIGKDYSDLPNIYKDTHLNKRGEWNAIYGLFSFIDKNEVK